MIHGYEFFGATERWVHIGLAPFGAMECRYLIEGEITTIGIDPQRVDGDPLKDMRMILLAMDVNKLRTYFESHGARLAMAKGHGEATIPISTI